jgi:hypothetical protein
MNRKNYTDTTNIDNQLEETIGGHVVEKIPTDIAMTINEFVKNRPQKNRGINIDVFLVKAPLEKLIKEKKIDSGISAINISKIQKSSMTDPISKRCILYYIVYKNSLLGDYNPTDAFLLEIDCNAFCLISNYRKIDHKKVSNWIYRRLFPYVNRAFLTSHEMRNILQEMSEVGNFDLRMRMDYSKTKDMKKGSLNFYYEQDKKEELPSVDQIFHEKTKIRTFMRMMKIVTVDGEIEFTFSGEGHMGIYEGTFDVIFDYIVVPTIDIARKRLKNLSGRSMSERDDKIALPIKINFYSPTFDTKEKISFFLKKVGEYRRCFYSIVHEGNPYLFMYVIDRYDYSSLSLLSEGESSLVITPQIRTSADSMMRFTQYILDCFQDGDLIIEVPQ